MGQGRHTLRSVSDPVYPPRLFGQLEILHKDIYVDVIIFFPEKNRSKTY